MVAEGLDKFMHKVESLWGTESPPITLVTQMLQTLPVQRPSAMEVLQHLGWRHHSSARTRRYPGSP